MSDWEGGVGVGVGVPLSVPVMFLPVSSQYGAISDAVSRLRDMT